MDCCIVYRMFSREPQVKCLSRSVSQLSLPVLYRLVEITPSTIFDDAIRCGRTCSDGENINGRISIGPFFGGMDNIMDNVFW